MLLQRKRWQRRGQWQRVTGRHAQPARRGTDRQIVARGAIGTVVLGFGIEPVTQRRQHALAQHHALHRAAHSQNHPHRFAARHQRQHDGAPLAWDGQWRCEIEGVGGGSAPARLKAVARRRW